MHMTDTTAKHPFNSHTIVKAHTHTHTLRSIVDCELQLQSGYELEVFDSRLFNYSSTFSSSFASRSGGSLSKRTFNECREFKQYFLCLPQD